MVRQVTVPSTRPGVVSIVFDLKNGADSSKPFFGMPIRIPWSGFQIIDIHVVTALEPCGAATGFPVSIAVGHGTEFISNSHIRSTK